MVGTESNDLGAKPNATNKRETNIRPLHIASESMARSNKPKNYTSHSQTYT